MTLKEWALRQLAELWEHDRGKLVLGGGAFVLSVCVLLFGFFPMLFIALCTAGGVWLGHRLDRGEDAFPFSLFGQREHDITEI